MTKITYSQKKSLQSEIYQVLMAGYDNNGNEMGMGEMGECQDAAEQIVNDWCEKENIEFEDECLEANADEYDMCLHLSQFRVTTHKGSHCNACGKRF